MEIRITNQAPVILIDASYYVFHRYHATLKWYGFNKVQTFISSDSEGEGEKEGEKIQKLNLPTNDTIHHASLHTHEEFINAFKKHVVADIAKLKKKWKIAQTHNTNIIFCSDCPRSSIWRNEIYSAYKGTRVQAKTFNPNIFEIFYKMIIELNYYELESSNLEADDIVYITTKYLVDNKFDNDIIIITNDNDYLQILALRDRIFIHNMLANNSDITLRSKGTPSIDLLLKVLMGDTSDNIPSIWEKVGPKTALKLANMSEAERNRFISSKGSECQKNYDRNVQLVSFSSIPLGLAQKYLDKYKFIIT